MQWGDSVSAAQMSFARERNFVTIGSYTAQISIWLEIMARALRQPNSFEVNILISH